MTDASTYDETAEHGGGGEMEEVMVFPASFAQQRLWFLDRMDPGGTLFNMPLVERMTGPLDPEALRQALEEIVARHEALRTTFAVVDSEAAQVIAPPGRVELPVVDFSHLPAEEREAALAERLRAETTAPFDLRTGPLFRAVLLRAADEDHVLVLAMHHIVGDGWSFGVLQREMGALYDAFRQGLPSPLPELPIQYADYAVWQRERLSGEELARQVEYWKAHLAGAPPELELPLDRPRPPVQTYSGASLRAFLPRRLTDGLTALARSEGATLFMVLLAGYQLLLSRYSGQEHVVVGTPIAGRAMGETEPLIGLFINTLALHADLSGDPPFRELVRRVREATLGAYAHQDLPFEKLVEELRVERALSHSPVFQVMFNLLNAPTLGGGSTLAGTRPAPVANEVPAEKYDMTMTVQEGAQGALAALSYNPDLFDEATAAGMLEHYTGLLEAVVADPDRRLSRIPLMRADEARRVEAWTRGETVERPSEPVHRLFAERAARDPDAPAIRAGGRTVTRGELNARANRLAHRLRALGVGPETRVVVSLERSPEMVVCILAVHKAGGAYVPVDPAYPADRRAYMLEDSGARVVLTQERLVSALPPTTAAVLAVDAPGVLDEGPDTDLPGETDPEQLAYVIYTSGSTGRPKGVAVPHRGVANLAMSEGGLFGVGEGSRVLQFASFSFDASVFEWASSLVLGATLVMGTREELVPGTALVELMEREGVTVAVLPHSVLAMLSPEQLPSLRAIGTGGEACAAEVAGRWASRLPFFNAYGPTEITVACSLGVGADGVHRPPIGLPLPNTRVYLLDPALQPVPVGVPGEVVVGGMGVSRGYLGRPGLTAERFVPDPFSGVPGARMYRTGDRARRLADGPLDFLGRMDDQVKVRGFRIELGEIDAVVRAHPGVGDAVVIVREDQPGDKRITAYYAPAAGASAPTAAELRAHAAERLPEHMVPSFFVPLEALPLTPNGKVDKRALPAPDGAAAHTAAFAAAETPVEEKLAAIWKALLGVSRVGANDNFFELGGHSLLLAQVQMRVRDELGEDVPMVDLFRYPTVRSLAARLSGAPEDDGGATLAEKAREKADARRSARSERRDRRGR